MTLRRGIELVDAVMKHRRDAGEALESLSPDELKTTKLGTQPLSPALEERHSAQEYERLVDPRLHHTTWGSDGLILQLHAWKADHHHGHLGDATKPVGNGVMLWFKVDDFDAAVTRARELNARVILDVNVNPNAQHRELWVADPDGTTVVIASPDGEAA